MKFALNGALTIVTQDGANVEIREEVGTENFFLFGLTVEQVRELKLHGYRPSAVPEKNASLREILDFIGSGALAGGDRNLFRPLLDRLLYEDPFLVLADYQAYADCQERVSAYGATSGRGRTRPSMWRVWASSHPTAPSVIIASRYGG